MLRWSFLAIFIPRLAVTACTFLQPLLLERSIAIIGEPNTPESEVDEMIGAVAIVFTGVAVSHAMTDHMAYRCVTKLRGALVSHIIAKTHRLPVADAKKSAAVTLMSTDIESIATGLPRCFDLPVGLAEVGLGVYCLSRFTGYRCVLVVVMAILSSIISYFLGRRATVAYKEWSKSIEGRVAETSAVLSQLQVIKTLGLGPTIFKHVQRLRVEEIKNSRLYRVLGICLNAWIEFADSMTPIFAIALSLFWNSSSRHLVASEVYPVLSILALTIRPLITIVHSYSLVQPMVASLARIDEFLQLTEHKDSRHRSRHHPIAEKVSEKEPASAVEFNTVSMGPPDMEGPILEGLSFGIARGSVSVVLGSTGSGKSYFLQSVLGESHISGGSLYVDECNIAYCGQNVWLENGSLKENVIGPLPFDSLRYSATIRACMLEEDIAALPDGDNFKIGSRGLRLSGGQRARVSIARAVYSELSLVVLDDIFSSLDRKTAVAILTRLLGKNGVFRERKATVLLTTYLPECLDVVDSLVILDGKGGATWEKNTPPGTHRPEILELLSSRNSPTPSVAGDEQDESPTTVVKSETPDGESEAALLIRQKGDWGLYNLVFDAFGKGQFAVWLLLVASLSFGEIAPSVYLRFWISLAPSEMVYFTGFALLGVFTVAAMAFSYCVLLLRLSPRASYELHKKLLNTTLRSTLTFFSTTDAGSILNRYSQDMTSISYVLPKALYSFLYAFIFQIFQIAAIVSGSTYMIAILAPMIAIAYAVQYGYLRTSRQLRYLDLESKTPLYTLFTETTDGLMYIRAYGWQQHKLESGFARLDASQKPYYLLFSLQRWLGLILDLLAAVIAVVLASLALKLRDTTSEAAFGLSFYHAIEFSRILTAVIRYWTHLETTVGAISRLRSFLRETPVEPEKGVMPPKNWPRNGRIQLQRVTARYSTEKSDPGVLKCISLTIEPGQKIRLSGRTGSGKSSLLMTLLGFLSYSGNIKIDGLEISAVQRDELRQRITTISQEQLKLAGSIRYNLEPYDLDASDPAKGDNTTAEEPRTLLERLCLWESIAATRGGLDAPLADAGLSHGQTQLLCVARAVLRRRATGSRLVLVDEATSSVDPATDAAARRVMAEEFAGCTVLTVAHRAAAAATAAGRRTGREEEEEEKEMDVRVEMAQGRIQTVVRREGVAVAGEDGDGKGAAEERKRRREASMTAIAQMAKGRGR